MKIMYDIATTALAIVVVWLAVEAFVELRKWWRRRGNDDDPPPAPSGGKYIKMF